MKKNQFLIAFALLIAVTLASCSKDKNDANNGNNKPSNDSVSFVINGGTFKNKPISFHSTNKATENGAQAGSLGYLKINADNATGDGTTLSTLSLDIAFDKMGESTSLVNAPINTPHLDNRVYFGLNVVENGKTENLDSYKVTPKNKAGSITISHFGAVGGTVEGTFEGTVQYIDAIKNVTTTYTISKGKFVVTRIR